MAWGGGGGDYSDLVDLAAPAWTPLVPAEWQAKWDDKRRCYLFTRLGVQMRVRVFGALREVAWAPAFNQPAFKTEQEGIDWMRTVVRPKPGGAPGEQITGRRADQVEVLMHLQTDLGVANMGTRTALAALPQRLAELDACLVHALVGAVPAKPAPARGAFYAGAAPALTHEQQVAANYTPLARPSQKTGTPYLHGKFTLFAPADDDDPTRTRSTCGWWIEDQRTGEKAAVRPPAFCGNGQLAVIEGALAVGPGAVGSERLVSYAQLHSVLLTPLYADATGHIVAHQPDMGGAGAAAIPAISACALVGAVAAIADAAGDDDLLLAEHADKRQRADPEQPSLMQ